jgi:hypothetical protein
MHHHEMEGEHAQFMLGVSCNMLRFKAMKLKTAWSRDHVLTWGYNP